ncbi:MarR family winged helix-turn-helix transcriptional regulator [Methylorubrum aminovorans]
MVPTEATVPALSESGKEEQPDGSASYAALDNLLGKVSRKNQEVMNSAFAISHDRLVQKIIWHLSKNASLTSKQLREKTGASAGAISKVVNALEERNIITRTKGSHGSEPLYIRDDLREPFKRHADHVQRLVRSSFHVLDKNERRAMHDVLQRIYDRLDAISRQISCNPDNYIDLVQMPMKGTVERKASAAGSGGQSEEREASKPRASEGPHDAARIVTVIERQTRHITESYEKIIQLKG